MTLRTVTAFVTLALLTAPAPGADADLILHHGKVVTVDPAFSIRQAVAVQGGKILRVGTDEDVLKTRGPHTEVIDLGGIGKDFQVTDGGPGYVEKDPATGEPTGIIRSCTRYVKSQPSGRQPTEADHADRLVQLFKDYNSVGLTGVIDRNAAPEAVN